MINFNIDRESVMNAFKNYNPIVIRNGYEIYKMVAESNDLKFEENSYDMKCTLYKLFEYSIKTAFSFQKKKNVFGVYEVIVEFVIFNGNHLEMFRFETDDDIRMEIIKNE